MPLSLCVIKPMHRVNVTPFIEVLNFNVRNRIFLPNQLLKILS